MTPTKKLLPPAKNTAPYPIGEGFMLLTTPYQEGMAAETAFNANTHAAETYLNWFNDTWMVNYLIGRDLAYDANPQAPPKTQWALVTEDVGDLGAQIFRFELVDSPTGALVCVVPAFKRRAAPDTSGLSMIDKLRGAGAVAGNPTIPVVEVAATSTASDGTVWVRIQ